VAAGFLHVTPPDTGTPDAWVFKVDSAGYLQAGGAPVTVTCRPLGLGSGAGAATQAATLAAFYPNPATEAITIRYHLPTAATGAEVVFFDALGRVCAKQTLRGNEGETSLTLAGLQPGVYSYRILVGGQVVQTGQVVKLP
jgi:hypothetical protein